ncbi:hypothetical protein HMPREF1211_00048 [Streptomyces sp. HGB0020]|jgi:hypothetical protein|nr:hypothetical protein HMPREF1211_00048 [Streptomyces sp. HGB0020]
MAAVLQALELVRRRLATDMRGDPGAFTGFARLHADSKALAACDASTEIVMTATATKDSARCTEVELLASAVRAGDAGTTAPTVVSGFGVTIYPGSQSEPAIRAGRRAQDLVGVSGSA